MKRLLAIFIVLGIFLSGAFALWRSSPRVYSASALLQVGGAHLEHELEQEPEYRYFPVLPLMNRYNAGLLRPSGSALSEVQVPRIEVTEEVADTKEYRVRLTAYGRNASDAEAELQKALAYVEQNHQARYDQLAISRRRWEEIRVKCQYKDFERSVDPGKLTTCLYWRMAPDQKVLEGVTKMELESTRVLEPAPTTLVLRPNLKSYLFVASLLASAALAVWYSLSELYILRRRVAR